MKITINNKVKFFIITFLLFTILPLIKIYNFKSSYYDFGFYLNYYKQINNEQYDLIFNYNYQIINIVITYFLKIFSIENWFIILIIIQSLALSIPYLIFKNNLNIQIIYFLFPTIWFSALNNFHPDALVIPFIFLVNKELDQKIINEFKILIYFIFIILIKMIFILLILGYVIILLKKKKIVSYITILFLLTYFFLLTFLDNFSKIYFLSSFLTNIDLSINNLTNFKFLLSLLVLIFCSGFFLKPNFIKIIPAAILLLFYYLYPFYHQKFYYNHYFIPLVPFFISAIENLKILKKIKNKLLLFILLLHICFSPSPISFIFWSDFNWFYDKYTIIELFKNQKTHNFIKDLNLKNKTIIIENNAQPIELFKDNNFIYNLGTKSNFLIADYIFLRSQSPFFIDDVICPNKKKICDDQVFLEKYKKIISNIKYDFNLIFDDKSNIKIYENKKLSIK